MSYLAGPGFYPNLGDRHNDEVRAFAVAAVLRGRMSLISAAVWYRVEVAEVERWVEEARTDVSTD